MKKNLTKNERKTLVVLVRPSHPGNIGAAARAMKAMGVGELVLVQPKQFPHADATARAAGADDVLARASVVETLEEAIADAHCVIGTSARSRNLSLPMLDPRSAATKVCSMPEGDVAAIVFGCEQSGLSNEELSLCQYHVHIPTSPEFSSLNLAQAVQILVYEVGVVALSPSPSQPYKDSLRESWIPRTSRGMTRGVEEPLATSGDLEGFFGHLQQVLLSTGFLKPPGTKSMMLRLRRLFNRAKLSENEVHILRGILSSVEKKL